MRHGDLVMIVRSSFLWERGDDFSDKVLEELNPGDFLIQVSEDPEDKEGAIEVISPRGKRGFVWYDSIIQA